MNVSALRMAEQRSLGSERHSLGRGSAGGVHSPEITSVPRRRKLAGARCKMIAGLSIGGSGEQSCGERWSAARACLSAAHRETAGALLGQQASTRLSGGPGNVELACAIPGTAAAGSPR